MNKQDIIAHVAEQTGESKAATARVLNATFARLTSAVRAHEDVFIRGFGTIKAVERAPRKFRNPITGASIHAPARWSARVALSPKLKSAANGGVRF